MRLIDANALANYANNQTVGITANDIMRFPTVDEENLEINDQNSVKETSGITVKDFLSLFSFILFSVEFYECGSFLNGATITEVSDWNVDYVRGIYYKVSEPTIGDKNFAFLRPRKFEVILELEVIRPDYGL